MGKKLKYLTPTVIQCSPYTAEEQETRFKKDYEFNKPVSARSTVSGWEDKYIRQDVNGGSPSREVSLVKGAPHKFRQVRTGNIYSNRKAIVRTKSR